jgi:Beta propeller domain
MKKALLLPLILVAAACGDSTPLDTARLDLRAALEPVKDCNEAQAFARDLRMKSMNRQMDELLKSVDAWKTDLFCGKGLAGSEDVALAASPESAASPRSNASASSTSSTNNQVVGVDEADFVKNDNKYIYVGKEQTFRIIDAFPGSAAKQIGSVAIEGEIKKLFIDGERAWIYASVPKVTGASAPSSTPNSRKPSSFDARYGSSVECTYGYDCTPRGDGNDTEVTVLDIGNKTAPKAIRTLRFSGSLIAARKIGSAVHTVVTNPGPASSSLELETYVPYDVNRCGSLVTAEKRSYAKALIEQMRARNARKIEAAAVAVTGLAVQDSAGHSIERGKCENLYRSSLGDGDDLTSVVSVDVQGSAPAKVASVLSKAGHVYASGESLYLAVPHTRGRDWFEGMSASVATSLHKFSISANPSATAYRASGLIRGGVLNQFAMDEDKGVLRVATTVGRSPTAEESVVATFAERGNALTKLGEVGGIAPTEDIRSVRFDGDRGYIVTFKNTDPLFTFDLTNPNRPRVLGELKIPGFSTYMHMLDSEHLLTIGYDSANGRSFNGILLQIFDVRDPKNPTLKHKETIATGGGSSEALTNHLAFNFLREKGLLALPMTICDASSRGPSFSGLALYDVSVTNGFTLKGRLAHPQRNSESYDASLCSNGWTNGKSTVKRSVFMDNFLYSIALDVMRVATTTNLSQPIAAVPLE